jgi:hypothetical protein
MARPSTTSQRAAARHVTVPRSGPPKRATRAKPGTAATNAAAKASTTSSRRSVPVIAAACTRQVTT